MNETQDHVYLGIKTPLGADALILTGFSGEEALSEPFLYTLEMHSGARGKLPDLARIVGQVATVTLIQESGAARHIHGYITRVVEHAQDDAPVYVAELRPWLWLLGQTSDSRIFQGDSVPEIITKVCSALGFRDIDNKLSGAYPAREYCVQFQESALDFVSRLMEDEGIFYYFKHSDSAHTLVLVDRGDVMQPAAFGATLRYQRSSTGAQSPAIVTNLSAEQMVVTGRYEMSDYNFETPTTTLDVKVSGSAGGAFKIFEYPGRYGTARDGQARAEIRIEAHEQAAYRVRTHCHHRGMGAGSTFTLSGHDRASLNLTYAVERARINAGESHFECEITAFRANVPYRPARRTPRPRLAGTQTALVVGPAGEELFTDKYGRIKVQFHWDREGKKDENSSCWLRVAQSWAGRGFGAFVLPRIGQEVVVSFLDGDPDRPLVTGCIFNADQTPPYVLPANATRSTFKSSSSKGGGGFNELRFEDKKDSEEVYVHAQKDLLFEVLGDWISTIGRNRKTTLTEGDETFIIEKGKRSLSIKTGGEVHEVKGTREVTVEGDHTFQSKSSFSHSVGKDYTLKVSGNLTLDVSGSVTIKSGTSLTNKAGTSLTNEAGMSITNKASVSMTNDGGTSLTSKASATQTIDGGGTLVLKGGLVKIN